ncbi:Mechanosensitive ion channel protein 8 [Smittium mucronatum]|uniref:Mechanosensitive ion channel protein 8 n=1 Tax=Smittium mucronatum TaxID=133383 RepID=A0A1R0GPB6_9FUNG|nr:Mechanosensitive ion channel protein 8 [Smittium mucronatum]
MTHPYDVGDHLKIDQKDLIVKKIDLLTTTFAHINGQHYIIPNAMLLKKQIINFRRSENQAELYTIGINFDTPLAKIDSLAESMRLFVQNNPLEFKPRVIVKYLELERCSLLNLSIGAVYRNNWQNSMYYWTARNKFMSHLRTQIVALKLTYTTEINNINIVNSSNLLSSIAPKK